MHVLVTGGAGYVGSHLIRALMGASHQVTVLDNLSSGHRRALPAGVRLIVADCGDRDALDEAARETPIAGIMHMAASCSVGESMVDPGAYYRNNLVQSLAMLDWLADRGAAWLIHSSTCAVYGAPERQPIDESACPLPINAYGATKLAVDRAIGFYAQAHRLTGMSLRYFNAAGAHPSGEIGEDKTPASNLIPRVLQVALERQPYIEIYGEDYPSPDGTGVRDYIHVDDLASAHLAALGALATGHPGGVFNLGTGVGHSVHEVIEAARQVTGHPLPTKVLPRREGDPPLLVAAPGRAEQELGWQPQCSSIERILADAWHWHQRNPHGFHQEPPA